MCINFFLTFCVWTLYKKLCGALFATCDEKVCSDHFYKNCNVLLTINFLEVHYCSCIIIWTKSLMVNRYDYFVINCSQYNAVYRYFTAIIFYPIYVKMRLENEKQFSLKRWQKYISSGEKNYFPSNYGNCQSFIFIFIIYPLLYSMVPKMIIIIIYC